MTRLKDENGNNCYPNLATSEFIYSCPGTLWLVPYVDKISIPLPMTNKCEYKKEKEWFRTNAANALCLNEIEQFEYKIVLNDNTIKKFTFYEEV
jgi:hypothetical protein